MNKYLIVRVIRKKFRQLVNDQNLYLRFLALFLAVVLWFLAGGEARFAPTERLVSVPLEVVNLPKDLSLITQPDPVRVRIRALSPLLTMAEREIWASVDLAEAIEGEGTYGVDVHVPAGVEIVSVNPRWVRLRTEEILEKEFAVTVALVGLPPQQALLSLIPEPAVVTVRAPRTTLERVAQVTAFIPVSGPASRLEGKFPVRAIDIHGEELDGVELDPQQVRVVLEQVSRQAPPSRDVPQQLPPEETVPEGEERPPEAPPEVPPEEQPEEVPGQPPAGNPSGEDPSEKTPPAPSEPPLQPVPEQQNSEEQGIRPEENGKDGNDE